MTRELWAGHCRVWAVGMDMKLNWCVGIRLWRASKARPHSKFILYWQQGSSGDVSSLSASIRLVLHSVLWSRCRPMSFQPLAFLFSFNYIQNVLGNLIGLEKKWCSCSLWGRLVHPFLLIHSLHLNTSSYLEPSGDFISLSTTHLVFYICSWFLKRP